MATGKINKVQTEIEKARERLMEQQARIKELENKKTELENMRIVDIVRGMSIPLDDLAAVLQSIKGAAIPAPPTSGQVDPKSAAPPIITGEDDDEDETEDETE
jgi:predicted RNase H-like nuclease (RuvC/YqgF family)